MTLSVSALTTLLLLASLPLLRADFILYGSVELSRTHTEHRSLCKHQLRIQIQGEEWKRDLEPRAEQAFPYAFKVSRNVMPGSAGSLSVDLCTHERVFVKSVWKGFFAIQNDTFLRLDVTGIADLESSASCTIRLLKEGGLQLEEDLKGKSYQLVRVIWGVPASRVFFSSGGFTVMSCPRKALVLSLPDSISRDDIVEHSSAEQWHHTSDYKYVGVLILAFALVRGMGAWIKMQVESGVRRSMENDDMVTSRDEKLDSGAWNRDSAGRLIRN